MKRKKQWCFCPHCGKYIVICDGDDEGGFLDGYCEVVGERHNRQGEEQGRG